MSVHDAWYALTWVSLALNVAGWGLIMLLQPIDHELNRLGLLLIAVGTLSDVVYDVANHKTLAALLDAGYLAWIIWLWWNDGGGTRLRCRLSRLKRRLSVRRPVPQGA